MGSIYLIYSYDDSGIELGGILGYVNSLEKAKTICEQHNSTGEYKEWFYKEIKPYLQHN